VEVNLEANEAEEHAAFESALQNGEMPGKESDKSISIPVKSAK
jgi:hypothetical protein